MKAGVASPNGVVIADVAEPKPKSTDLLIKIKAIALNRADLDHLAGELAADRPQHVAQRAGDRGPSQGW